MHEHVASVLRNRIPEAVIVAIYSGYFVGSLARPNSVDILLSYPTFIENCVHQDLIAIIREIRGNLRLSNAKSLGRADICEIWNFYQLQRGDRFELKRIYFPNVLKFGNYSDDQRLNTVWIPRETHGNNCRLTTPHLLANLCHAILSSLCLLLQRSNLFLDQIIRGNGISYASDGLRTKYLSLVRHGLELEPEEKGCYSSNNDSICGSANRSPVDFKHSPTDLNFFRLGRRLLWGLRRKAY